MSMSEDNIRYDQVKIICAEDCGKAPKKELLRAFNVAFVCNDISKNKREMTAKSAAVKFQFDKRTRDQQLFPQMEV